MSDAAPRLTVRMPATPLAEVVLRVAVNALAVAVDRDERAAEPRPAGPHWLERPRPAPGSLLSFSLQQLERALIVAHLEKRREEAAGGSARGPRLRIAHLTARQARLLRELAAVDASEPARRDGPFFVRLPALLAHGRDGWLERAGRELPMKAERLELSDLGRWALLADRPRGLYPIYQLNTRASLTERGSVTSHHRDLFRSLAARHLRAAGLGPLP